MTVEFPIIAPEDGDVVDPAWASYITETANDHETRIGGLEISGLVTVHRLAADSSPVNNSTTYTTITGLPITLDINTAFIFELYCPYNSNVTADIKIAWTLPAGSITDFGVEYWDTTGPTRQSGQSSSGSGGFACGGFAADLWFRAFGSLITSSTAGSIIPQFAQNTANVSNTVIRRGAYLRVERVS